VLRTKVVFPAKTRFRKGSSRFGLLQSGDLFLQSRFCGTSGFFGFFELGKVVVDPVSLRLNNDRNNFDRAGLGTTLPARAVQWEESAANKSESWRGGGAACGKDFFVLYFDSRW
jgi:hypothetical protein